MARVVEARDAGTAHSPTPTSAATPASRIQSIDAEHGDESDALAALRLESRALRSGVFEHQVNMPFFASVGVDGRRELSP